MGKTIIRRMVLSKIGRSSLFGTSRRDTHTLAHKFTLAYKFTLADTHISLALFQSRRDLSEPVSSWRGNIMYVWRDWCSVCAKVLYCIYGINNTYFISGH